MANQVHYSQVDPDVLGVIDEIKRRYEGRIVVQYLNPSRFPEFTDAPYQIVERRPDGKEDVVFSVWQLDGRVLAKLEMIDGWKNAAYIDRVVAHENKAAKLKAEQKAAQTERNKSFVKRVLSSDKAFKFYNDKGELIKWTPDKAPERVK